MVFPITFPPGIWAAKSIIFGVAQLGSHRWTSPLESSPSHRIIRSSSIVGCQVAFAIGAWRIMTALRIRVPKSQIHIVVGISSVLVASREPETSKDMKLVPVFGSAFVGGDDPVVGGQMACVAATNSREKPPFCEATICSCHIYCCQSSWGRKECFPTWRDSAGFTVSVWKRLVVSVNEGAERIVTLLL